MASPRAATTAVAMATVTTAVAATAVAQQQRRRRRQSNNGGRTTAVERRSNNGGGGSAPPSADGAVTLTGAGGRGFGVRMDSDYSTVVDRRWDVGSRCGGVCVLPRQRWTGRPRVYWDRPRVGNGVAAQCAIVADRPGGPPISPTGLVAGRRTGAYSVRVRRQARRGGPCGPHTCGRSHLRTVTGRRTSRGEA
jgi:hypothetical protein